MALELGKMLVKAGKITEEQLQQALDMQKKGEGKLGEILVKLGAVPDENVISEFIGKQLNIGALRLTDIQFMGFSTSIRVACQCIAGFQRTASKMARAAEGVITS